MLSSKVRKIHRQMGYRPNNPKSVLSTVARKRRLDEQVRDAEEELRYWTR